MLLPMDRARLCSGSDLTAEKLPYVLRPQNALNTAQRMWANEFERSRLVRFDPVSRHTRHNRRLPFPSSLQNAIRSGQLILLLDDARMITAPVVSQRNGELQTSGLERESLMFRTTIERALKRSSFSSGRVSTPDIVTDAPMSFADSIAVNNRYLLGEDKKAKDKEYVVDLQCVWDNGQSVGEIPILLTFDNGVVQRCFLPADGHLVVEGAPSASYKAQLKPEEDDTSELRTSIQETLTAIIEQEKAEAAMHQSLQDQMGIAENVVVHTGAMMWGVWNWAKDTSEAIEASVKLATPIGSLSRVLQASYAASQAGPESTWQETFLKSYSDQQHEDFLKALGFDPLQIKKEQLAEAYEIANFVYEDGPTRAALKQFSKDYVTAQDSIELAESLAPTVIDTILTVVLTAVTGVGGAFIVAKRGLSLFKQLGRLLVSLGKALKKSELSKRIVSKLSNKPERFEIRRPEAQKLSEPKRVDGDRNDGRMQGKSGKYPNAKPVELDSKGRFVDKNGNFRTNAGPNAPVFEKWKDNGGTVMYDEATDTIIYGKPKVETSSMGRVDAEVPYKPGPPDGQRYPDFSEYSKETVEIPEMKGVKEQYIDPPEGGDFSKSWEALSQLKGDEYIENTFGMFRRSKGTREGQWPDKSPEDYTWHHHGDQSSMQLVDEEIHDIFTHKGGASVSRE